MVLVLAPIQVRFLTRHDVGSKVTLGSRNQLELTLGSRNHRDYEKEWGKSQQNGTVRAVRSRVVMTSCHHELGNELAPSRGTHHPGTPWDSHCPIRHAPLVRRHPGTHRHAPSPLDSHCPTRHVHTPGLHRTRHAQLVLRHAPLVSHHTHHSYSSRTTRHASCVTTRHPSHVTCH
jgi:hypothetical protein